MAVKRGKMAEKSNAVIIFYYFSPWEINLRSLCGVVHRALDGRNYTKIQYNDDDETGEEGGWNDDDYFRGHNQKVQI